MFFRALFKHTDVIIQNYMKPTYCMCLNDMVTVLYIENILIASDTIDAVRLTATIFQDLYSARNQQNTETV